MAKISHRANPKEMKSPPSDNHNDVYTELGNYGARTPETDANMNATNTSKEFVSSYKDGGNKKGGARSGK